MFPGCSKDGSVFSDGEMTHQQTEPKSAESKQTEILASYFRDAIGCSPVLEAVSRVGVVHQHQPKVQAEPGRENAGDRGENALRVQPRVAPADLVKRDCQFVNSSLE